MRESNSRKWGLRSFIRDPWTHIYGLITLVSFVVAIYFSIVTLNKSQVEFKDVLFVCVSIITILTFVLVKLTLKYANLADEASDILGISREHSNLISLLQIQAETTHNISHYFRSLINDFDNIILKLNIKESVTQAEIDYVCDRNSHFLIMLTSSLQNYFSIHTDDNCSVTLKILSDDNKKIKTVFRDPVNLKKRRQSELTSGLSMYNIKENTAFKNILDDKTPDIFYACDNLRAEYENHEYENSNRMWNSYYNATVVVPISKVDYTNNMRNILGFLTVDNKEGYLVDNTVIEYMFAISDLLYTYVHKYKTICTFTAFNNLKNNRKNDFIWN